MKDNVEQNNNSIIPAPPALDVFIRTMESDLESLRQSGGADIEPMIVRAKNVVSQEINDVNSYSNIPPPPPPPPPPSSPLAGDKAEVRLNVPGYTGPEQPIFQTEVFVSKEDISKNMFKIWRFVFAVFGIILVVVIFWFVGYFLIFPRLFPQV
jgi:hypothetical protein